MPVKPKAEKLADPTSAIAPVSTPDAELVDLGGDVHHAVDVFPKLDPTPPFLLAYHPQRWAVVEGYCVPALATVVVEPGVNNVENLTRNGRTSPDWTAAAKLHTTKGATIIPHAKGPGGRSYMQRVQVRHGHHHMPVFATAHRGSDEVTVNGKGYSEWLESLFDDGTLAPPPPYVLRNLRAKYEQERATYADRAYNQPSALPFVKKAEAALAAIDKVIAKFGGGEAVAGESVGLD
jgi:hypothetical protein